MNKKQKKAENNKQRGSWFGVNPQTRVIPNKKHYKRKPKYKFEFTDKE